MTIDPVAVDFKGLTRNVRIECVHLAVRWLAGYEEPETVYELLICAEKIEQWVIKHENPEPPDVDDEDEVEIEFTPDCDLDEED